MKSRMWCVGGRTTIEKVQGLVFITYRTATLSDSFATDKDDQEVDMSKLSYTRDAFDEQFVTVARGVPDHQGQFPGI